MTATTAAHLREAAAGVWFCVIVPLLLDRSAGRSLATWPRQRPVEPPRAPGAHPAGPVMPLTGPAALPERGWA